MMPVIGIPLRYGKLEDERAITYMNEKIRRTIMNASGYVFAISPVQDVDYVNTRTDDFRQLNEIEKRIIENNLDSCF